MNIQSQDPRQYEPDQGDEFRLMPHNLEAEQALLGAIFINNDAYYLVSEFLRSDHFYEGLHRKIYEICVQLIADGKAASPITAKDFLPADMQVGEITVGRYLVSLAVNATTIANAGDFGRSIRDLHTRRGLIKTGEELVEMALSMPADENPGDVADAAIGSLQNAVFGDKPPGLKSIYELAVESVEKTSKVMSGDTPAGFSTGLRDLDSMVLALSPGDNIPLYGRSGDAKTALSTHLGVSVARQGGKVLMIQMDMKAIGVAQRVLSTATGISVKRQRKADIDEADYKSLLVQSDALKGLPFNLVNPGRMTWSAMKTYITTIHRSGGLDMVIIDHQMMVESENRMSDIQTVTNFFFGLVDLCSKLNIISMPLVQLKRESSQHEITKPKIYDAWGGGAIEQSADIILGIHNEHRQLTKNKPTSITGHKHDEWRERCDKYSGKIEIGVLKDRSDSEAGYRMFNFNGEKMLFSDISKPEFANDPMGLI